MKKEINFDELNYIIYCRKSSDSEDRQVQSLETQLRELTEYATKHKLKIVETITESQSAHSLGREGFGKMTRLIENKKANAILVLRANRISRNPIDAGHIINLMDKKLLLYVRTSSGTCYTNNSSDKMMLGIELIFSKKDSDDKSNAVKEGFKTKYLKGLPGGIAPFGFINTPELDRGQRYWKVDEIRFEQVKELFRLFLTGTYSGNKIAEYCVNVLKMTTLQRKKTGGKLVQISYIHEILKNPIYAGFFYSENVRYELDKKLPRIITEEEHYKILVMLGDKNKSKFQKHENFLEGFLVGSGGEYMRLDPKFQLVCDCKYKFAYRNKTHCPKCNTEISKIKKPKYYHLRYYYNGALRHKEKKCKIVEEKEVLQKTFEEIINPLSLTSELTNWAKTYVHEILDKDVSDKIKLNKVQSQIKDCVEKEKMELRALLRRGIITDEEYKQDLELLQNKVPVQHEVQIDWKSKIESILDLGLECKKVFENGSIKDKREILLKSQSNLIWDEKNLYISRPSWLEAYINGVKRLKQEIATIEPKINDKKALKNKDFSSMNTYNFEEKTFLLRSLESN